jgi:hypothetical protein
LKAEETLFSKKNNFPAKNTHLLFKMEKMFPSLLKARAIFKAISKNDFSSYKM